MGSDTDSIGRASLLTMAGSYLLLPLNIAGGVLLARVAGPEVKGSYTVYAATLGLLILPGFAVQSALTHFVAGSRPSSSCLRPFLRWVVVAQSALSLTLLTVVTAIGPLRKVLFANLGPVYLVPALAFVAFNFWCLYRSAVVSGLQQYSRNAVVFYVSGISSSLVTLGSLVVWWRMHYSPTFGAVVTVYLAGLIVGQIVWTLATRSARDFPGTGFSPGAMAKDIGSYAAPIFGRGVLEWANLRVDVYFVNAFVGSKGLGIYTVAVGVSQQLWTVPFSLAGPLFAKISRDGDCDVSRETGRLAFRVLILSSTAMAAAVAVLAPILLPAVYGTRFAGAVVPLLLLLPGVVAIAPTKVLASYLNAIGKPSEPLRAEFLGLIATVTLDVMLIPRHGAAGAAIASSAAYLAFSGFLAYRFKCLSRSQWFDLVRFQRSDVRDIWSGVRALVPRRRVSGLFSSPLKGVR